MERERGLDRFLTFVDAVVAIAITLLVLPLAELAGEVGDGSVTDLLDEHRGELFAFFLSFFVIARLWFAQHHVVDGLVRQDPARRDCCCSGCSRSSCCRSRRRCSPRRRTRRDQGPSTSARWPSLPAAGAGRLADPP